MWASRSWRKEMVEVFGFRKKVVLQYVGNVIVNGYEAGSRVHNARPLDRVGHSVESGACISPPVIPPHSTAFVGRCHWESNGRHNPSDGVGAGNSWQESIVYN